MKTQIKLPKNCHLVTALSFFSTFFTDFVLPHWRESCYRSVWCMSMMRERGGWVKYVLWVRTKNALKKLFTLTLTGQWVHKHCVVVVVRGIQINNRQMHAHTTHQVHKPCTLVFIYIYCIKGILHGPLVLSKNQNPYTNSVEKLKFFKQFLLTAL